MHILLFFSGFLPKGSQRLACQLLNCLFAANTPGINYSIIKILLLLFFTALGLKPTTLHMYEKFVKDNPIASSRRNTPVQVQGQRADVNPQE